MVFIEIFYEQVAVAQGFWKDQRTRTPILIIWVASFGGALHASVTTYFYLKIGATDVDIGIFGFIMSCGSLVLSPVFGWALDARGPFEPIFITAGACALGCLIRGTSTDINGLRIGALFLGIGVNLWTVVLAHVANCSDRKHRSAVISGFSVQETMLKLTGKGLFPLWDLFVHHILNVDHTLSRFRMHMGICTLFCLFGWFALLVERFNITCSSHQQRNIVTSQNDNDSNTNNNNDDDEEENVIKNKENFKEITTPSSNASHNKKSDHYCSVVYFILIFALFIQSFASTVVLVLWPLFLRDRLAFTASEFGVVMFIASLATTLSVASFPKLERKFGASATASGCSFIAAMACIGCFVLLPSTASQLNHFKLNNSLSSTSMSGQSNDIEDIQILKTVTEITVFHIILAIILQSALMTLEPSLKTVFSLHVPVQIQGRSIGMMATIGGVGGMGGNLIGTYLYQISKQNDLSSSLSSTNTSSSGGDNSHGYFFQDGRLPFLLVTLLLGFVSLVIWFESYYFGHMDQVNHQFFHNDIEDNSLSLLECRPTPLPLQIIHRTEGLTTMSSSSPSTPCCVDKDEEDQPLQEMDMSLSIGPLLHLETSYDLKLD